MPRRGESWRAAPTGAIEMRDHAVEIADLYEQEHLTARDEALARANPAGALMRARQAQTAREIGAMIAAVAARDGGPDAHAWTRDDLAEGLALLDGAPTLSGIALEEYRARADDLLSHLSVCMVHRRR